MRKFRVLNDFDFPYCNLCLRFFQDFFFLIQSEDSTRHRAETVITFVTICPCTNFIPQNRKKDDTVPGNMKELESTSRENNLKQNNGSPGEEIALLKNDGDQEHNSSFTEEVQKYSLLNCSSACLAVTKYFETHTPEYGRVSHFLLLGK